MTIAEANAAAYVATWAADAIDQTTFPVEVREHIAFLGARARQRLGAGPTTAQIAALRAD